MASIKRTGGTQGFTLIEISIVLVVIGLLIGGIIMGKEMINNATRHKLISEVQAVDTATNTFKLKYACLPGDCNATESRRMDSDAAYNTCPSSTTTISNNGVIEMPYSSPAVCSYAACATEASLFARQLNVSGLVRNQGIGTVCSNWKLESTTYPRRAMIWPANWYYSGGGTSHWLTLAGRMVNHFQMPSYSTVGGQEMSAPDAAAIDGKMDDGLPLSGSVRSVVLDSNFYPLLGWNSGYPWYGACSTSGDPTTAVYRSALPDGNNVNLGCMLGFKASF